MYILQYTHWQHIIVYSVGYMIIGCMCGPYVLNVVTTNEVKELGYVTQISLAFIAYSAGSELYIPELRELFRSILWISFFLTIITYIICSLIIYSLAQSPALVPWAAQMGSGCIVGVSLIAASIMTARSPASAIAVVKELRSKGPATSTMLGVTVFGDLIVLVLFTISASIAMTLCAGTGFEGGEFIITILTLVAALGIGYALGGVLIFLLWVPRIPAYYTILPLGFIIFLFCDWFAIYSFDTYGFSLNFDALLICITSGYVVTNQSKNRIAFIHMLGTAGPIIFIPFFTKVGVELNLVVLAKTMPFAVIVFTVRAACVCAGCYCGGTVVGLDAEKKKYMWISMLAQAGVSLGLASEVAVKFPEWGSDFQSTIVGVVLINQFVGPVACKWALKKLGEAGRATDNDQQEHDTHMVSKLKRIIFIGNSNSSNVLSVAQKVLDTGKYGILVFDYNSNSLDKLYGVLHVNDSHHSTTQHNVHVVDISEHLHIDVQQIPSVNEDGVPNIISVVPDNTEPYKSDFTHQPHKKATNSQYIITQQLDRDTDACVQISDTLKKLELDDATDRNVTTACIDCVNDIESYTAGLFCIDTLNIPRVITTIYHPSCATLLSQHGIIPIFNTSTQSQLLYSAIDTMDAKSYKYVKWQPTDTLATLHRKIINIDYDLDCYLHTLTSTERTKYLQEHPPVNIGPESNIVNNMKQLLKLNKIDMTSVVADAHLDLYHNTMAQSYMTPDSNTAFSELIMDTTHAEDVMAGPAMLAANHSRRNTSMNNSRVAQLKHSNNSDA